MWYFTWILGVGLALAFGVVNVMWLEASYSFGHLDEDDIYNRFGGTDPATNKDPGSP